MTEVTKVPAEKRSRTEGGDDGTLVAEKEPALTFPYVLDTFQSRSIEILEAGESVLVSAHTSAGKTTVALYAIAKALKEKKRVIYTSPIKALSNQKFREFTDRFDSVGLMTGDTTIKPDADCLVMTTEILRSMLYRGTEMLREVGCVVFDEVHYMRDKNRGVVWEETIVMLPEGCQYVFLSATIPNAREFADWIEHIHEETKCHVVHTDFRPTPLQHFLYPQGADGIFLVVDESGSFRDDNFRRAMQAIGSDGAKNGEGAQAQEAKSRAQKGKQKTQPIMNIIRLVMDKKMYPVIVFCFAKAECERNALALAQLNFNSDEEEALVNEVYGNAIESLAEDDRKLPAIEHLLPLLRRGVAIHHSGLLPILKEVVELLFGAGLVKCLFATETFSMGLNMPARTVVFSQVRKFDGEKQRYLTGGEYIQMSGRAGRRGLDRFGIVIAMIDESIEPDTLRQLTSGGADVLNSSFHLTYNMVLNLLRVEDVEPEYMMTRSFCQFQRERNRPQLEASAEELQAAHDAIAVEHADVFSEYEACKEQLAVLRLEDIQIKTKPKYLAPFMVAGRVVRMRRQADGVEYGWGIVTAHEAEKSASDEDGTKWTVDVMVCCAKIPDGTPSSVTQYKPMAIMDYTTEIADVYVVSFLFTDVETTSRLRINMPASVYTEQGKQLVVQTLAKLHRTYKDAVPPLTPEDMGINDDAAATKVTDKMRRLQARMASNELEKAPSEALQEDYARFLEKEKIGAQLDDVRDQLKNIQKTVLREELKQMMRVLRRLDYIDKDNMIMRKGRVACEITSEDESEILLTELLFKGLLNDMETEMIVSLMSCLVNVNKTPDNFSLPEEFQKPLTVLKEVVTRLATVSVESGLIQTAGEANSTTKNANERLLPSLMEVTYKWAKGAKFIDVIGLTAAYEGDIVRMMRRLEEILRQMAGAARSAAIGSIDLHDTFMKGIEMIKRDIIFASSLYL
jgi:ATP-dependent RNA helicase DOB1